MMRGSLRFEKGASIGGCRGRAPGRMRHGSAPTSPSTGRDRRPEHDAQERVCGGRGEHWQPPRLCAWHDMACISTDVAKLRPPLA